ncbi:hypothetical protein BGZ73_007944 [Actinomortierella ambigua]|nr:hypothetical protein BGZ73_007944 [Actinomortierella ambigua]
MDNRQIARLLTSLSRHNHSDGSSEDDDEGEEEETKDRIEGMIVNDFRPPNHYTALSLSAQLPLLNNLTSFSNLRRLVWVTPGLDAILDSPQGWLQMRQAWLSIYSTVEELYVWNLHCPDFEPIVTLQPRLPPVFDASSSWSTSGSALDHRIFCAEYTKPHFQDDQFYPPGWDDATFPNLKTLFLGHMGMPPETFLRLTTRCPNLRSVLWPHFRQVPVPPTADTNPSLKVHHYSASPEFVKRLPTHFFDKVSHIWFGRAHPPCTTEMILRRMRRLRRLDLQHAQITDEHLAVILQQHPDIEEIDVSFSTGLSSNAVWAFLSRATKLKRFEADRTCLKLPKEVLDRVAQIRQPLVTTKDSGEPKPEHDPLMWACQDLEVLMVGFDIAMGSILGSKAMFSWLAQFPKLRYLRLASTSMTLTEAGGLYQLATLRRLKYFVLDTAMYDELTRKDVHWMLDHWPQLKRLHLSRRSIYQWEDIRVWAGERGREDAVKIYSGLPDV